MSVLSADFFTPPSQVQTAPPKSLRKLFVPPPPDKCTRCDQRVYPVEKVGPVNEVIFHKQCFKCCQCGVYLTLKTYFCNQDDFADKEIYCTKHCPRSTMHGYDARAVGIRSALAAPGKARQHNEQIRGTGAAPLIGTEAIGIRGPMTAQNLYQRKYITKYDKHHFPAYLVSKTKDKLFKYQEELERQQREEEDRLMAQFQEERMLEAENMKKEFESEWENQLKELTAMYEGNATKKKDKSGDGSLTTERYEEAKEQLKKTMTVKMMKKKEAVTMKLQRKAQQETATLVQKHAEEMLELLQSKQEELQRELEMEIIQNAPELDDQEEFLEVAKAALLLPAELPEAHAPRGRKRDLYHDASVFDELDDDVIKVAENEQATFSELVRQLTENCLSDLQKARAIFRWITIKDLNVMEFDDTVNKDTPLGLLRGIKYGTEAYHTLFMRLCSYAGLPCREVKGHAKSVGYEPGMKIAEDKFLNTWNVVLIMGDWWPVQCNWGARHLVLNKDLHEKPIASKSQEKDKIRYQYDEHYFLTDPDEFIQEFWAKDPEWQLLDKPITLDEFIALPFVRSIFFHYGLEFIETISSVVPCDNKGGAEVKINVPDDMGDDVIFHYQLFFAERERRQETEYRGVKLERFVFHSLSDGCALFSVHVPTTGAYYLEIFANKIDSSNKLNDDPNSTITPFRLKCACKFKLTCDELVGKMHPLPNCATGEWGPAKARRHFGLMPVSHSSGVIAVDTHVEVTFKQPRPLIYVAKLRFNDYDDKQLQEFLSIMVENDTLIIRATLPQVGQYGLDIYAKPNDHNGPKGVLAHVCKYLLNCTHVNNPVNLVPISQQPNGAGNRNSATGSIMSVQPSSGNPPLSPTGLGSAGGPLTFTAGPVPLFDELAIRTSSHPDPIILRPDKSGGSSVTIEVIHPDTVRLTSRLSVLGTGEDITNKQSVVEKAKGKKTKFTVTVPKDVVGPSALGIFAIRREDGANYLVYNYVIDFNREADKRKK